MVCSGGTTFYTGQDFERQKEKIGILFRDFFLSLDSCPRSLKFRFMQLVSLQKLEIQLELGNAVGNKELENWETTPSLGIPPEMPALSLVIYKLEPGPGDRLILPPTELALQKIPLES